MFSGVPRTSRININDIDPFTHQSMWPMQQWLAFIFHLCRLTTGIKGNSIIHMRTASTVLAVLWSWGHNHYLDIIWGRKLNCIIILLSLHVEGRLHRGEEYSLIVILVWGMLGHTGLCLQHRRCGEGLETGHSSSISSLGSTGEVIWGLLTCSLFITLSEINS